MEIQYFKSAWGDIKNSPGWFGKLCLLTLLNFIPIFGQIVTFGYLYGWAREIAWGAHEPMPRGIFANEDGKFWRRGWFTLVLTFVFALVPGILMSVGNALQGLGFESTFFQQRYLANPAWVGLGTIVNIVAWVLVVLAGVLAWIGNMRVSIYDRLSAGFQLGKVWKMLRHDTGGILRIFGMELLFSFIFAMILAVVFTILISIVVAVGLSGLISAGYNVGALEYMTQAQAIRVLAQFFASAGLVGVFALLIGSFIAVAVSVFVDMLVVRAMGYWTMQFEVSLWGGQDDPMPFELAEPEPVAYYAGSGVNSQPQPGADAPVQGQAGQAQTPVPAPIPTPTQAQGQAAPTQAQQEWVPSQQLQGWRPGAASGSRQDPDMQVDAGAGADVPVNSVAPVDSGAEMSSGESIQVGRSVSAASPAQEVDYGEPAVVGAEFLMTPAEIDAAEAEVQAQDDAGASSVAGAAEGSVAADAIADSEGFADAAKADESAESPGDSGIGEYHVPYEGPVPDLFGSGAPSAAPGGLDAVLGEPGAAPGGPDAAGEGDRAS